MKKFINIALTAALSASLITLPAQAAQSATETISYNYSYDAGAGYSDETVFTRQMEKLDRGLVAVNTSNGVYLSWRLWDSEDARYGSAEKNVSFNVYRGTQKIATVTDSTNYIDKSGNTASTYSVAPVVGEIEGDKCESVTVLNNNYFDIPLTVPQKETVVYPDGTTTATYSFFPADCSTGDVDGDGEYEIIIKWTSSERDVGSPGDPSYSGTVRFSAYKLDGTKLWDNDINLGRNVYSSAHTVQFLVYDFNGDGKAEMMCQTSLGSKDAAGNYVTKSADPVNNADIYNITDEENESADYRSYIIVDGEEFLTVFNGETGIAMDTIPLPMKREVTPGDQGASFGDTSGNRSNRFLANVAYLDGEKPYAVYLRGYYFGRNGRQRTSIAGISFDGERLSPDYRFDTEEGMPGYYEGAYKYVGNGNHNCTVADVDNDGKDEFITGALCMEVDDENNFKPRWCTFMEHGDALHIGDYDPTHPGFEFFTVHEDQGPNTMSGQTVQINFGMSIIDANNGDIMLHVEGSDDTGRGLMANIGAGGYYQVGSARTASYKSNGGTDFEVINVSPGSNFRVFWDGDLYDEPLDGTTVSNWTGSKISSYFNAGSYGVTKINGSKSNPALQADLFGDWREELVYPTTDGKALRVFTTTDETEYKIKTLMHDPVYRSSVAAEQTAYNQPPHVGMYMGSEVFAPEVEGIEITKQPTKTAYAQGEALDTTGLTLKATYVDGTSETVTAFTTSGYDPEVTGKQTVTVSYLGAETSFDVTVMAIEKIEIETPPTKTVYLKGQEVDTTGMVVKAYFEGGLERYVTDYKIGDFNPMVIGDKTITVTYQGKTTEFTVSFKEISGITVVSPPSKTVYHQGQSINTDGMVVYANYSDGTSSEVTGYAISGFNSSKLGEQTVTVKYNLKSATFTVKVIPASITSLNNTYSTNSTDETVTETPIGSYNGNFTIEHTVKVNSMPANGSGNKSSTAGFFVRFMANGQTGGGWYFTRKSDTELNITWKNTRTTSIGTIKVGEEYTFRYDFVNVGTGSGATATLTVTDSNGNKVASVSGLNLRNFSDTATGKTSPITYVQIYNQANANSTASVTFDNARIYSNSEIVGVDGSKITLNLTSLTEKLYAAKYENGTLTNVEIIEPTEIGTNKVVNASFEPDKVFLWSEVYPVDMWAKTE